MLKNKPVVVFVGTYPPRECGIATFNQDLLKSSRLLLSKHLTCKVVAVNHSPVDHYVYPPEVEWEIDQETESEYRTLATTLNHQPQIAGLILQHEYGIYGGLDGEHVLTLLENYQKPILVTLHTVLPHPSPHMKAITSRIIRRANCVVVLTEKSRQILAETYPFSIGKVYVIPHGIHETAFTTTEKAKKKLRFSQTTVISTFGLLSRGKGIEFVIKALPEVIKHEPSIMYLILGETHPKIRRDEGESYRLELTQLVKKLNLNDHVKFYDQYLDLEDLLEFLKATDIYISTSINPNQAVSGTLSYALGAGRAVISTAFAQAQEIITPQNGRLVPIKNSAAISSAILDILSDPKQLSLMHQAAYTSTRPMLWRNVAEAYSNLLTQLVLPPITLKHLKKMTDDFGLFQFAHLDQPNLSAGYTLDDNARALIVCCRLSKQAEPPKGLGHLITTYLNLIAFCQLPYGKFVNYISHQPKISTQQNLTEDLSDATSRAMWALSEVISCPAVAEHLKKTAQQIFLKALPNLVPTEHLRAEAFLIKAYVTAYPFLPEHQKTLAESIRNLTQRLVVALQTHSQPDWHWFEPQLGYNNAVLPEGLLLGGTFLQDETTVQLGLAALQFLIDETFSSNQYAPIGHSQWYQRNGPRSYYDQQPEDPAAMILALSTASRLTGHQSYQNLAQKCFSWFLGNNSLRLPLYNYETGGCYDGLHPDRVNLNQGAESLVSYLLSRITLTELAQYENPTTT